MGPDPSTAKAAQVSAAITERSQGVVPSVGRVLWSVSPPLQNAADLPAEYRESARLVRAKYRHLYELPVIEYADGSRSFHEGRLYRCHGLNVLLLHGDFVEMAFQHGRLLVDQIPDGALPQSAKLVGNAIANMVGDRLRLTQRLAEQVQRLLTERMLASSRDLILRALGDVSLRTEAVALSDACGIPMGDMIRGLFNPNILMILAKHGSGHSLQTRLLARAGVPPVGCSTFAAWGRCTTRGDLLIGRNMDYPLNGFYDRFPTVIYFEPTVPSLRYMSFVSAGIHSAGITSYNEAGLFLASHVVPSIDVSAHGIPPFVAADQIIRRARTFESAAELFRRMPPPQTVSFSGQVRNPRQLPAPSNHCVSFTTIAKNQVRRRRSYASSPHKRRNIRRAFTLCPFR